MEKLTDFQERLENFIDRGNPMRGIGPKKRIAREVKKSKGFSLYKNERSRACLPGTVGNVEWLAKNERVIDEAGAGLPTQQQR